jgi:hypothetical protein
MKIQVLHMELEIYFSLTFCDWRAVYAGWGAVSDFYFFYVTEKANHTII